VGEPFASIVLPTLGRPALRRALRGLLEQTERDWEAIVVDDGDGRGSALARSFGEERITTFANPGSGQADARIAAIARARGELVCWLDDDDWWEDGGHLAALRAGAAEPGGFFFRGGWIVREGETGDGSREVFDLQATARSLRENNTVLTSSIAYPRAVHRQVGLLDRELGGYCDWDLMLRMCDAGLEPRKLPGLGVCYSPRARTTTRTSTSPTAT
jgi:glycosyltransferase involved in cell wall biosynthesis